MAKLETVITDAQAELAVDADALADAIGAFLHCSAACISCSSACLAEGDVAECATACGKAETAARLPPRGRTR